MGNMMESEGGDPRLIQVESVEEFGVAKVNELYETGVPFSGFEEVEVLIGDVYTGKTDLEDISHVTEESSFPVRQTADQVPQDVQAIIHEKIEFARAVLANPWQRVCTINFNDYTMGSSALYGLVIHIRHTEMGNLTVKLGWPRIGGDEGPTNVLETKVGRRKTLTAVTAFKELKTDEDGEIVTVDFRKIAEKVRNLKNTKEFIPNPKIMRKRGVTLVGRIAKRMAREVSSNSYGYLVLGTQGSLKVVLHVDKLDRRGLSPHGVSASGKVDLKSNSDRKYSTLTIEVMPMDAAEEEYIKEHNDKQDVLITRSCGAENSETQERMRSLAEEFRQSL